MDKKERDQALRAQEESIRRMLEGWAPTVLGPGECLEFSLSIKEVPLVIIKSREHIASTGAQEQTALQRPLGDLYIGDLSLSVRTRKCLNHKSIEKVEDLIKRTSNELLEIKNFGSVSLLEIREKLTALGLKLADD